MCFQQQCLHVVQQLTAVHQCCTWSQEYTCAQCSAAKCISLQHMLSSAPDYTVCIASNQSLLSCRLGKIAITMACGLLAFGLSDLTYYTDPVGHADTYLSSPLMPVLVSILVGYTISNVFLQVSCMNRCTCKQLHHSMLARIAVCHKHESTLYLYMLMHTHLLICRMYFHAQVWTCCAGL